MRPLIVALAMTWAVPAFATTGVAWQWPAEGHRFLIGVRVSFPQAATLMAEKNDEFRTSELEIDLVTTCKPEVPGPKSGFHVTCALDDVSLRADPTSATNVDKIVPVLGELDDKLTGASVQLALDAQGHIKTFDLEGVDKGNERISDIQETARLLVARAFALLDFVLPKDGDDKGRPWRVSDSLATSFPSNVGTLGSVAIDSIVGSADGAMLTIKSTGKGVTQSGETSGSTGRPMYTWQMTFDGTATFDSGSGRLIERTYLVDGEPTPESAGSAAHPYLQHARLVALGANEKPELAASGTLPAPH